MNWIEQARIAMKEAWGTLHEVYNGYIPEDEEVGEVLESLQAAIQGIPAEPEMMVLLRLFEDWCTGIGEIGRALTDDDKILIGVIRQTIEREFSYKLPEE